VRCFFSIAYEHQAGTAELATLTNVTVVTQLIL